MCDTTVILSYFLLVAEWLSPCIDLDQWFRSIWSQLALTWATTLMQTNHLRV